MCASRRYRMAGERLRVQYSSFKQDFWVAGDELKSIQLSQFQVDVFAATLNQQVGSTATSIAEEAVSHSEGHVGLSAAYLTLDKLERWGFVFRTDSGEPSTPRRDRSYVVTAEGHRAFRQSLIALLADVPSAQRDRQFRKWRRYAAAAKGEPQVGPL